MPHNPIFRSLWQPVLWMGMERVTGASWVLFILFLVIMGLMFAGAYLVTLLIVAGGVAGGVYLAKLAEQDPQFTRVALRRTLRYRDIYPACRTRIATVGREIRFGKLSGSSPPVRRKTTGADKFLRGAAILMKLQALWRHMRDRLAAMKQSESGKD